MKYPYGRGAPHIARAHLQAGNQPALLLLRFQSRRHAALPHALPANNERKEGQGAPNAMGDAKGTGLAAWQIKCADAVECWRTSATSLNEEQRSGRY
jgi:hypothetical protein